jgi:restriction endonuclease S subunit
MKNNWQTKKLGDVLEYEQPTRYIVSSTDYKEDYETPVLTAGKSFILGKTKEISGIFPKKDLPVIIFDDFTTATKFVDFPFKVKSSAMKILHPVKNLSDAKFLFYLMQNINLYHAGVHKRYWISEYSKIEILLPPLIQQKRIAKTLDEIFEKTVKARAITEQKLADIDEFQKSILRRAFSNSL